MGGVSLDPGDEVLTLKWSSRGLMGGGVMSGPGLERGRERERERSNNEWLKVNINS